MESVKIIKRIAIGLLCLSALALIGFSIFQHQRFIKLSQGVNTQLAAKNEPGPVAAETAVTVQKTVDPDAPAVIQGNETDDIDGLRAELAATEQELEKVNKQLSEKISQKAEKEKAEKGLQRMFMSSSLDSQYASLFEELNLSPEKLQKLKDLFVDKNLAMQETYKGTDMTREATQEEKAEIKKRTDKVKDEYEAKYKKLLGDADYEKYTAYNDRSGSRSNVTMFKQSLGSDETLTKDQEKALVEIIYNEQEKAENEKIRNQPKEPSPGNSPESIAGRLKDTETAYSKMIENAKDTLSSSQLEKFKEYLKGRFEMMETSAKISASFSSQN
jgi:hypothetical protein